MAGKKVGPDRWIPIQLIGWSLASGGQFFVHNKTGFFLCRFFIGLCMGGFIPDAVLYLSYFYTKREMPILTLVDTRFDSRRLKPHTKLAFRVIGLTRDFCFLRAETFSPNNSKSAKIDISKSRSTNLLAHKILSVFS
jgi:hypothetical protein